jgi:hypothetical protein
MVCSWSDASLDLRVKLKKQPLVHRISLKCCHRVIGGQGNPLQFKTSGFLLGVSHPLRLLMNTVKNSGYLLKGLDMTGVPLIEIATLLGRRHVAQWESTTLTR